MQIRRLREERGYSLEELAERSGLSFRGLIYIEHGRRNPGVLTILSIASGLNVALTRLFEDVSQAAHKTETEQPNDSAPRTVHERCQRRLKCGPVANCKFERGSLAAAVPTALGAGP